MLPKTILYAEDDDAQRETLTQTLATLGYEVIAAKNGRVALETFRDRPVDLVLSDIQMPEMSGLELLRAVRGEDRSLPFILLTGFDHPDARDTAETYCATAYLLKPFRIAELRQVLDSLALPDPLVTQC